MASLRQGCLDQKAELFPGVHPFFQISDRYVAVKVGDGQRFAGMEEWWVMSEGRSQAHEAPSSAGTSNSQCVRGKMCLAYHLKRTLDTFLWCVLCMYVCNMHVMHVVSPPKNLFRIVDLIPDNVSLKQHYTVCVLKSKVLTEMHLYPGDHTARKRSQISDIEHTDLWHLYGSSFSL